MGEAVNPYTYMVYIHATAANLFEPSQKYFNETRKDDFPPLEASEKLWKKMEEAFDLISSWLDKNSGSYPYVMVETISYADFVIMSRLIWGKSLFGVDSPEWARIASWNGGRWGKYAKEFERYEIMS
ncbi:hypothetical protein QCA50_006839 [Cerrena zonata]|uniref:Glutathione S-transferase UstS-like C-terminal domain-containing protein n=1 Tax=Cerrena zonata TaxID=2478898 RepID=A0AAW0G975_9APHY